MQGKSLSLICGSLTWLREHKRKQFLETVDDALGKSGHLTRPSESN